jgi:predicted heme/steroid binding protein
MYKKTSILILSIMAVILLTFSGCGAANNSTSPTSSNASAVSSSQKIFSAAELKKYDGQNGNPAYVAVDGIVYDVTNVKNWENGTHHGLSAGQDLTQAIKSAPHGTSVLKNLPIIGKFKS